jgi:polysaccharide export outer membrane protein
MPTRRVVHRLGAALALGLAAGGASAQVAPAIAPRDQLSIIVYNGGAREDAYSGKFLVDVDGTFEYPTLGRIKAAALTPREVEAELKTRLEKYLVSPQVTITLEQTTTNKVVISGQVNAPATYTFAGTLTLLEALTRAGSITDEAGEEAVVHRAPGPDGMTHAPARVDIYELLNGLSLKNNIALQDGDTVIVPKSEPVFMTGHVQSPGPVRVKRDTTVLQALSMAGGVTDRGSTRAIKIQRLVDGKKKDIPVKDINTDLVKPGDTVVVPARVF